MKKLIISLLVTALVLAFGTTIFALPPTVIYTDNAPEQVGPYSQALQCKYAIRNQTFISGQLPFEPGTLTVPLCADGDTTCFCKGTIKADQTATSCSTTNSCADGAACLGGTTAQTAQVMTNLGAILSKAGLTFKDVYMATVYLTGPAKSNAFNLEYGKAWGCTWSGNTINGCPVDWTCGADSPPPARATIVYGSTGLPAGSIVEVSVIAGRCLQ